MTQTLNGETSVITMSSSDPADSGGVGSELARQIHAKCPNLFVRRWIEEMVALCQPDKLIWCNGSLDERKEFLEQGVRDGTFIRLNQQKLPGCFLHRSNPNDVARS